MRNIIVVVLIGVSFSAGFLFNTLSVDKINLNAECNKYRSNVVTRFSEWYTVSGDKNDYAPKIFYTDYVNDCVAIFIAFEDNRSHYVILNPITFEEYFSYSGFEFLVASDESMKENQMKRIQEFNTLEKNMEDLRASNF